MRSHCERNAIASTTLCERIQHFSTRYNMLKSTLCKGKEKGKDKGKKKGKGKGEIKHPKT